jgi:hypothetical protein
MTERDCLRNGEWKKVNYYPVSIEKLQRASMREAAYLIAPVNIGEDYEYFDKVKHLLDIPDKPKSIEELSQELNEKIDKLITKTKNNFYASKTFAESRYEKKFDKIFDNFEYAKEHGQFPFKFTLDYSKLTATGSNITSNFVIKSGGEEVGYYTTGNGYLRFLMDKKPNFIVRFCMNKLLDFRWIDT